MSYEPVADDERRWAATESQEPLFRGPCGPLFNGMDRIVTILHEQSAARCLLVVVVVLCGMPLMNAVLEDEHIAVLSSGAKLCADKSDYLEKANHRCQVANRFAKAYLKGEAWVKCADFTRGAELLKKGVDSSGTYWYDLTDKSKVAFFYSTCNPTCASTADVFHPEISSCNHGACTTGLCKVEDEDVLEWLRGGRGESLAGGGAGGAGGATQFHCQKNARTRPGINAITDGTDGVGRAGAEAAAAAGRYYLPEDAGRVRDLYTECSGPCACNDQFDPAAGRCFIADPSVRIFFDPAPQAPGDITSADGERVNVLNALCKQMTEAISNMRTEGGLQGDYNTMSYLPMVKSEMAKLYATCARHVPCPSTAPAPIP